LKFIDKRPYYYRTYINGQEYIFCHAGLKPGVTLENQTVDTILWIREEFYNEYNGTAEVVVGHTPTPYIGNVPGMKITDKYYPIHLPNKITMLDTGSFLPNGRISCIDVISGKIWQSRV